MVTKNKILLMVIIIFVVILLATRVEAATTSKYKVTCESIVLNSNDEIKTILPAGTIVKVTTRKSNGYSLIQYYEKLSGKDKKTQKGYIETSMLKAVNSKENLTVIQITSKSKKTIKKKIEIVELAQLMESLNIKYSQTNRLEFYKNFGKVDSTVRGETGIKKILSVFKNVSNNRKNTQTADCSSLCATIYNRVLGMNFYRTKSKSNLMVVKDFVANANNQLYYDDVSYKEKESKRKIPKMFSVVKSITNGKGKLNKSKMQIGDAIIIGKANSNRGYDHMAMYIGNGKIIEAISSDGGLTKKQSIQKVIIRDIPRYYYEASTGVGGGQWTNVCQLRPLSSYMTK